MKHLLLDGLHSCRQILNVLDGNYASTVLVEQFCDSFKVAPSCSSSFVENPFASAALVCNLQMKPEKFLFQQAKILHTFA